MVFPHLSGEASQMTCLILILICFCWLQRKGFSGDVSLGGCLQLKMASGNCVFSLRSFLGN